MSPKPNTQFSAIFAVVAVLYASVNGRGEEAPRPLVFDLGTLGGATAAARAVSQSGQVVGTSTMAGETESHAFSWTRGGGLVDLGTLGGAVS